MAKYGNTTLADFANLTTPESLAKDFNCIGIACNDIGAANWLVHLADILSQKHNVYIYTTGPARQLFAEFAIDNNTDSLEQLVSLSNVVFTGTGWATNLESNVLRLSKEMKKQCYVLLDHWQDYRKRFSEEELSHLKPKAILVTNLLAHELACEYLPEMNLIFVPDLYLDFILSKMNTGSIHLDEVDRPILYLSDGQPFSYDSSYSQLKSMGALCRKIETDKSLLGLGAKNIILRPHPADNIDSKTESQITSMGFKIVSTDLVEQVMQSKLVVGTDTYALYLAMRLGKRVISTLPKGRLPRWLDFCQSVHDLNSPSDLDLLIESITLLPSSDIYLRRFSILDIDSVHLKEINDTNHLRYSQNSLVKTTYLSACQYLEEVCKEGAYLAIIDKCNERVGTLTLRVNGERKDIEIGILIYKRYSGRGFGTTAWLTAMNGLNKVFGSYRIWAGTLEENIAMIRLLEKSGFHLISKESQDYFRNGKIKSVLFFGSSKVDIELNRSL